MSDEGATKDQAPGPQEDGELRQILGDEFEAVVSKPDAMGPPAAEEGSAGQEPRMVGEAITGQERGTVGEGIAGQERGTSSSSGPLAGASASLEPTLPVQAVHFGQLDEGGRRNEGNIELLLDVKLPISVELGRTETLVKEILEYGPGTVIELNKLAGEPVDVFVNGRMVAQGEVVVVDEHFGVRVTNLLSPRERVQSLA